MQLDQNRLNELFTLNQQVENVLDVLQAEIDLNGGQPIEWDIAWRTTLLRNYTLSVWWLSLSIACYPLSAASVVFYGEPTCP